MTGLWRHGLTYPGQHSEVPLEEIEDPETRAIQCLINHGSHEPYTHRHADEPDVTYCLRCRVTL